MTISKLIENLERCRSAHGDLSVFTADMAPIMTEHLEVTEAEFPEEYGEKYLYVRYW